MAYDIIDFTHAFRSDFKTRDHSRIRSINTLERKKFPMNFNYVTIEKSFGEMVAMHVWRIVYESIHFSILKYKKYFVCIHDLPNEAIEEIALITCQSFCGV